MKCRHCKEDDVHMTKRGLCRTCYRMLKESGKLDDYPVKKNPTRLIVRLDKAYGEGFWKVYGDMEKGIISMAAFGDLFGLTRQRISQIVKLITE